MNSWFEKSHLCISLKQSKTLDHCKINQYTYIYTCMHAYIYTKIEFTDLSNMLCNNHT